MSPRILSLDCTNMGWTSLGLAEGGEVRGELNVEIGRAQASLLPELVRSFLGAFGFSVKDVDMFAAAAGPGSFTGIKVGLAFVQFLAWASEKKVIPLSSLESIAFAAGGAPESLVCPLLRAGGGKVWSAVYSSSDGITLPRKVMPEGIFSGEELMEELSSFVDRELVFLGDFPQKLTALFPPPPEGPLISKIYPRGASAALLAWLHRGRAVDPADLEARYLKEPDIGR